MNAPAYQEDTPHVTAGENWAAYVRRITCGLTRKEIAEAANLDVSGVSRWLRGVSQPSPEKAIEFARSLEQSAVDALIAAGYLDETDVPGAVTVVQSLSELSDDVLVDELRGRLRDRVGGGEQLPRRSPMGELRDKSKRRTGGS